ncbi:MAG: glycosyltransferase family 2 protein [Acidimicrobiia bacterium]
MPDVILPALNEAEALKILLPRMPAGFRAIVVDNASTDDTASVAQSLGARVVRAEQRGFGAACFAGLCAATDEIVCFMDADGSLDPTELPLVVAPILDGDADLVMGTRQADRGTWPFHLRLANRYLARTVSKAAQTRITDLGPMRAAKRESLLALNLQDRRFGWPLEMVLAAAHANWRIAEVPVTYVERVGKSKVTGTLRGLFRTVLDMSRWIRHYRAET